MKFIFEQPVFLVYDVPRYFRVASCYATIKPLQAPQNNPADEVEVTKAQGGEHSWLIARLHLSDRPAEPLLLVQAI